MKNVRMGCAQIAVIAPERVARDLYAGALSDKYDILVFLNGDSMVAQLEEMLPAAVIIDIGAHDIDCEDIIQKIRSSAKLKNVMLVVTADCEIDEHLPDSFWEKQLGVDVFLSAPLTPERIRAAVDTMFLKKINPQPKVGPGYL